MTAWSYCAMAPLNDGSGAKAMKCSQLSKYFVLKNGTGTNTSTTLWHNHPFLISTFHSNRFRG